MAKRKTSAALAWMLTAAMAINSGSVVWAAEDGMISVERIDAGETAEFSDSSEEISSLVNEAGENVTENEDTVTFSSGESVSALADGDEETTITGVTVSNPESIPSVFYKQFLDQSFGDTGELDLKNAVKNTTFNINLSNGESKTVTGLGEVEGYGTVSIDNPYDDYRNYPEGSHPLSLKIGAGKYDTDYNYSVQDVKNMPEDYKVSVQSDDAFIPIKSVADGLNIKRFYFENTSDTKKTFQIKFNSQYVIDSALVSIDGNRAERMQSVTSAEPFLVELEAGGKAYVEYSGLADEVNIKEKNLVIKSVRLLTSQMFKDLGDEDGKYLFNNFHNVIVRVEAEIDGKTDYFVGNNVSQLGGINYTIKGATTGTICDLPEGEYSLTCSFGSLPGQVFDVDNKLKLVSYHNYYKGNENPVGEENNSLTVEFDKGKPYSDSMCVGATIKTAGTYVVQINYKDTVNIRENEFKACQWGEHSYNDMGGVMKLTYNVRKFSPGPLLVWAKNAKSFTVTKVSKEELEKLCEKCAKLNKSDYTGESWAQLEAQLKNAQELLAQTDISENQMAKAIVDLNEAIEALQKSSEPIVTPSPDPEPTVTPSPDPEPTVTPSPDPEPTVTPSPNPEPDTPSQPTPAPVPEGYPDGTKSDVNGNFTTPNGTVIKNDGSITLPDGSVLKADDQGKKPSIDKEGTVTDTNGTTVDVNGNITLPGAGLNDSTDNIAVTTGKDGVRPQYIQSEGAVITAEGSVISRPGLEDVEAGAGWKVTKEGIATDTEGNVYDVDGSVRTSEGTYTKPAKAVVNETQDSGNTAKVKMTECKGAQGYDYVIGKSADLLQTREYEKVIKNQSSAEASFRYTDKGTWYVACHAWTRDADGKKVFGQWSEVQKLEVTAITPEIPKIEKVVTKGSKITVTYTACEDAEGYDVVLGTKYMKANGEKRPTDYGKYVKKVKGNKVTVTFTNVKAGTYYIGLHAWNRTSEDETKVFSQWSETVKTKKK